VETRPATPVKGKVAKARRRPVASARLRQHPGHSRRTVLSDLLIFLTFVYIYSTNARVPATRSILFASIFAAPGQGPLTGSPAIFFLMLFTWLIGATIGAGQRDVEPPPRRQPGLVAARLWLPRRHRLGRLAPLWPDPGLAAGADDRSAQAPQPGFSQHAVGTRGRPLRLLHRIVIVPGCWRPARSTPGPGCASAGCRVAGARLGGRRWHRRRDCGVFLIVSVNINLVMADIVYKQGQQFDSQGNWVSSVELYVARWPRARPKTTTCSSWGARLLEQANRRRWTGAATLPETLTLDDVLALTPDVSQLGRTDLLRAAEAVLIDAQQRQPAQHRPHGQPGAPLSHLGRSGP
jgi:hypothetical protein